MLTNARGVYALPIAQYTIAAILRVAEQVDARREQQLLGRWPDDQGQDALQGDQLRGKTLVIVGYGGIGREIARLAAAHGMRVVAVKANPSGPHRRRLPGARARATRTARSPTGSSASTRCATVAAEADFLSITLPLTGAQPGHRQPRGPGGPARACLDHQHRTRPGRRRGGPRRGARRRAGSAVPSSTCSARSRCQPASPFWGMPNVVITPHVSGATMEHLAPLVSENLRRFVAGEPLINRVDPERGY